MSNAVVDSDVVSFLFKSHPIAYPFRTSPAELFSFRS
jgi:hypothetical protein